MGGLHPHSSGITSSTTIVANIFISFIGAGMLGLPYAFKEAGLIEGAVIMCVVGYLSTVAMLMIIDCKYAILTATGGKEQHNLRQKVSSLLPLSPSSSDSEEDCHVLPLRTDLTYGDVGHYAFGPLGKRLVDVAVVISQVGFCCGYLIYLCKNLSIYAPVLTQHQWLVVLLPPLYCLTLLRHLNKLAVFSLFAQVSNVFALAVVFWFDFSHTESVPFVPREFSLKGMPFFFSVAIYCYEGAGLILSLEESVAVVKRPLFRTVFVATMVGLTVLYVCFGASGYLSFGPGTEDIVTLNLPHRTGMVDFAALVKVCLGISLFFTYPMMMFPVSHLLDKTCVEHVPGNLLRLLVVSASGVVVLVIPNFGVLISLIGATCCTLLAFILPALFHTKIFRTRLSTRQRYFNVLLVFLGVVGTVVGLWDTFNRLGRDIVTVDELSAGAQGSTFGPGTASVALPALNGSNVSMAVAVLSKVHGHNNSSALAALLTTALYASSVYSASGTNGTTPSQFAGTPSALSVPPPVAAALDERLRNSSTRNASLVMSDSRRANAEWTPNSDYNNITNVKEKRP